MDGVVDPGDQRCRRCFCLYKLNKLKVGEMTKVRPGCLRPLLESLKIIYNRATVCGPNKVNKVLDACS